MGSKEEVLGLQVPACHSHFRHVLDAAYELLEVAVRLSDLEFPGYEDESIEVAAGAEFHHLAVVAF
jgi:hypothetical protein